MKFIKQINQTDCGVACLSMILLKKYNIDIPLQKLRELTKTDTEGTTIFGILEAAKKISIEANAYEGTFDDLKIILHDEKNYQ